MEKFKIRNFNKDHPDKCFPSHYARSIVDCNRISQTVQNQMGIGNLSRDQNLCFELRKKCELVDRISAADDNFNLLECLNDQLKLSVGFSDQLNVVWDDFSEIDVFNAGDLAQWFDYIWYPSLDDIEVFPNSLDWILCVDHGGVLFSHSAEPRLKDAVPA